MHRWQYQASLCRPFRGTHELQAGPIHLTVEQLLKQGALSAAPQLFQGATIVRSLSIDEAREVKRIRSHCGDIGEAKTPSVGFLAIDYDLQDVEVPGDPGGPSAAPKATRKSCHTSTRSPALISSARLEKTAPCVLTNTGVVFAITSPAFAALLGGMTSQASTCEYAPSGPLPRSTPMRATVAAKSGGLDNANVATGPSELLHAASVATPKHKRRHVFDRMRPPRLASLLELAST